MGNKKSSTIIELIEGINGILFTNLEVLKSNRLWVISVTSYRITFYHFSRNLIFYFVLKTLGTLEFVKLLFI